MNSSYGRSNNESGSINAFDFDLVLGSGRPKSMNDQKNQTSSYSSTTYNYSSAQQKPNTTSSWTHQPNKPAWTHQPAPSTLSGGAGSLSGPTPMVGDIFGKSWNSSAPTSSSASSIGIVNNKNPNLFGDLLSSAMGQNKSSSNVPLKNAAPAASQSTFSMGGMADSLPKTGTNSSGGNVNLGNNFNRSSSVGGGNVNLGSNFNRSSTVGGGNVNFGGNNNRTPSLGGPSMKSMAGSGIGGGGMGANTDPFVSLADFGSKPLGGMKPATKGSDPFGEFQNATTKNSTSSFSSNAFATSKSDPLDDFGFSNSQPKSQDQPSGKPSGTNDFDALFSSSSDGGLRGSEEFTSQQFTGDDWGINDEFGGGNDTGETTTEIEGLPPPPAGVTAPSAKNKGMDNYKQGQFADAIKWLSWAVVLLERGGDDDGRMEVLTCRASCYKEVGEYKKAVADCTKVLDHDANNVAVLVQRALLYESMEKYKLGAEDLRTVMKLDPGNRVARSTIHRLTKMAG
ncbi:hypothetical protein CDL12_17980 [Handroanthus impetiginosus]|uniref:Uncharacterized protein n=1 Tax=Handroanthus impetiginosus TaxID=429701 RepID=A0A2G9GVZ3_9LAMI|nr:hypothetical protein CDL12_17980 [Handroanthus impetiginosus]